MKVVLKVFLALVFLAMATVELLGCPPPAEPKVDVEAVRSDIDGIKRDMEAFKKAVNVIHPQSDVIVSEETLPQEIRDMAETIHLSSHGLKYLMPYMEKVIEELDRYKENPQTHKKEILYAAGGLEALRKASIKIMQEKRFISLMELPYPEKAPHKIAHVLLEKEEIRAIEETKKAAGDIHIAMHGLEDALTSMKLNLKKIFEAFVGEGMARAGSTGYTRLQLAVMAGCVIWGFIGTALFFNRRGG